MYISLPVSFSRIKDKSDHEVVAMLLKRIDWATKEFLYGKCYPVFKSLHSRFYSDCASIMELIHEIYIDIIEPRKKNEKCKLETFSYRSSLYTWVGVVSLHYCYIKFNKSIPTIILDVSDRNSDITLSKSSISNIFDREDLDKIIGTMTNDRYRQIIKLHYVEGVSNEETANRLGMDMPNYYNKHRLAKVQFLNALKREGLL